MDWEDKVLQKKSLRRSKEKFKDLYIVAMHEQCYIVGMVKSDLSKQSTKADIKNLDTKLSGVKKTLWREVLSVGEKVENLEGKMDRMEGKLDKISTQLDGFVGRVQSLTDDNEVDAEQTRRIRVQIDNHEKRITKLESSN